MAVHICDIGKRTLFGRSEWGDRTLWSRLGSGSVRGYFHDEVGVKSHADPFQ